MNFTAWGGIRKDFNGFPKISKEFPGFWKLSIIFVRFQLILRYFRRLKWFLRDLQTYLRDFQEFQKTVKDSEGFEEILHNLMFKELFSWNYSQRFTRFSEIFKYLRLFYGIWRDFKILY